MIDGIRYFAHAVIWAMAHGAFPEYDLDHIDGDGLNNRITNLRLVTKAENQRNQHHMQEGSSSYNGVAWRRRDRK
jgi:hypothetical protein